MKKVRIRHVSRMRYAYPRYVYYRIQIGMIYSDFSTLNWRADTTPLLLTSHFPELNLVNFSHSIWPCSPQNSFENSFVNRLIRCE